MQRHTTKWETALTVIEEFARFATVAEPPGTAIAEARICLLDWMGAAIAGGVEMPATGLRVLATGGPSRLLPDGAGADPRTAALINGTASHTVEVDDIYRSGLFHPGVVTVPAALALGEAGGVSGAALLRAIVIGYEVGNRIAEAVNPAHYQHWHTTATVGHFAAAAAASSVLDLGARQTVHALASVATMAAGLRHAFSADGMSKPLHAGRAAEAGVLSALAARAGVTGVGDMLEGERGFGAAMSGPGIDWAAVTATLGDDWTITRMTRKAHACCGHSFAALDAIAILMEAHGVGACDIAAIDVRTYRAGVEICGNPDPATAAEGRFSLPWCAALMVLRGSVTPAGFGADALDDPALRAMAARITLGVDDEAEARFPHARSAFVSLELSDGRVLSHRRPTRKGDPDDPLTEAEIAAKFSALSEPVVGREQTIRLKDTILSLDRVRDIQEVPLDVRVPLAS